ncbi:MAG TPA: VOC family protein [Gammaproteobacteria bacterium]|nr:VOC family protein [Gammaproteobacteria bacterium]
MNVETGLIFSGQCEAAFKFYEETLGAKVEFLLTWNDSPLADRVPPDWRGKIMHARLKLGDVELLGTDVLPQDYKTPQGFSVLLGVDDPLVAERLYRALADGGSVRMPLQQTFWSLRYGAVVDRFGIPWDINCAQAPVAATSNRADT